MYDVREVYSSVHSTNSYKQLSLYLRTSTLQNLVVKLGRNKADFVWQYPTYIYFDKQYLSNGFKPRLSFWIYKKKKIKFHNVCQHMPTIINCQKCLQRLLVCQSKRWGVNAAYVTFQKHMCTVSVPFFCFKGSIFIACNPPLL